MTKKQLNLTKTTLKRTKTYKLKDESGAHFHSEQISLNRKKFNPCVCENKILENLKFENKKVCENKHKTP